MNPLRRTSLVMLLALLAAGCSVVSEKQARDEFQKAHPDAKIYEQFIGEGDSDHAFMHFRYTLAG
jgi:hypothetical protein